MTGVRRADLASVPRLGGLAEAVTGATVNYRPRQGVRHLVQLVHPFVVLVLHRLLDVLLYLPEARGRIPAQQQLLLHEPALDGRQGRCARSGVNPGEVAEHMSKLRLIDVVVLRGI